MRRLNLLLGFHRLLLVGWAAWALLLATLTVPGWYHAWADDEWRIAPHQRIVTIHIDDASHTPVQILPEPNTQAPAGGWLIYEDFAVPLRDGTAAERQAVRDAVAHRDRSPLKEIALARVPCCWAPWTIWHFLGWEALGYLVGGPAVVYATLLALAVALRWVWRGLVSPEQP